jgi:hypothetical protein
LARIPAVDTEEAKRMVERLGREIKAAEAAARSDRDWERAHGYPPTVAMGSLGQTPAPPPRPYPSVVADAALRGLDG